ncbi:hypothetical protein DMA12_01585 [Amycolatopsis balhimycina DSM 5908]|uniref:Uncharacterized protein n=1 Tax=Amycolatopsis balhimycina DSM 5908 TaxID=1081091 RepID=A0A428X6B9_AMYBA|nr:hypothetical protein DMA12_01585 [Amycolatopsis balhimycina DSM 5908]
MTVSNPGPVDGVRGLGGVTDIWPNMLYSTGASLVKPRILTATGAVWSGNVYLSTSRMAGPPARW